MKIHIGAELQSNFEVLGSEIASGLKKIINEVCKRKVFIEEESAQKENPLSHGKAGRMDDLRELQGQRHRRIYFGRQ